MDSRSALYASLALLMTSAIIELSFISAMVGWLHATASGTFAFRYNSSTYVLKGEPLNFLVDQGHTSNGAAGTAFILVGTGGFLVLWLISRPRPSRVSLFLYRLWLAVNVLSLLLVLTALIYTFVITHAHRNQTIDVRAAAKLDAASKYALDSWTPQNWFPAVLKLDLVDASVRSNIETKLRVMRGWQYNLIPFFVVHLIETAVALWDAKQHRAPAFSPVQQKGDA